MTSTAMDAARYVLASLYWRVTHRVPWQRARRHGDWIEDNAVLRLAGHFMPAGRVVPPVPYSYVLTTGPYCGAFKVSGNHTLTPWTPNS